MNLYSNLKLHLLILFCGLIFQIQAQQEVKVERQRLGELAEMKLDEVSGIIPAFAKDSTFWVHNDSGDDAQIYLIDRETNLLCTFVLENIEVRDVEDIAWLNIDGKRYILLGDIGDNKAVRPFVGLHLFEEPVWDGVSAKQVIRNQEIYTLELTYPDGARDAESLFVDPITKEIFVISKRDFHVHVYKTSPFNDLKNRFERRVLDFKGNIPIFFATAADISQDGKFILIKNLNQIFLWERNLDYSVETTLQQSYKVVPYEVEPQGEAIAFDKDGRSFYTLSERPLKMKTYLYQYRFLDFSTIVDKVSTQAKNQFGTQE